MIMDVRLDNCSNFHFFKSSSSLAGKIVRVSTIQLLGLNPLFDVKAVNRLFCPNFGNRFQILTGRRIQVLPNKGLKVNILGIFTYYLFTKEVGSGSMYTPPPMRAV